MKTFVRILLVSMILMSGYNLAAKPLAVGDDAPDFTLVDSENKEIKLSQFLDKEVFLCFYRLAEFLANKRLNEDRQFNLHPCFKKRNSVFLGVNYDNPDIQKQLKEKYHFPTFMLLSDSEKKVAKLYDADNLINIPYNTAIFRIKNGKIVDIFIKRRNPYRYCTN